MNAFAPRMDASHPRMNAFARRMIACDPRMTAFARRIIACDPRMNASDWRMNAFARRMNASDWRMIAATGGIIASDRRATASRSASDPAHGRLTPPAGRSIQPPRRRVYLDRLVTELLLRACTPLGPAPPWARLVTSPKHESPAPAEPSGASLAPVNSSLSSTGALASAAPAPPPAVDAPVGRVVAALRAFLGGDEHSNGRAFVRRVIVRRLYPGKRRRRIDDELVDEITQLALARALDAPMPPWTLAGIPAWVRRLTRRAIADYFRDLKSDKENLDREADVVQWSDRHAPSPDWGAREHLIVKYLEGCIGDDARKKQTFQWLLEKEVAGRTVEELAAEHHTTPTALSNRFYKLRQELIPRVSVMDEEKPRRFVLIVLFFGALLAVLALALWLWFALRPAHPVTPPRPVPSASRAPAPRLRPPPIFDDEFSPSHPAPR
jgi:DNA-directed RNA polymerase specialized sigma24 family protein